MDINNTHILLVDDDSGACDTLGAILEAAGYQIVTAEDGGDAMQCVQREVPDLILLNIVLPDFTGYEVCTKIKEKERNLAIPVIFLTDAEGEGILQHCPNRMEHVIDYLTKPIRPEILLARVATLLEVVQSRKQLAKQNEQLTCEIAERRRLSAVIEQFNDSVLIVNDRDIITYANQACEKNSGYLPEELVGKQIQDTLSVKTDSVKLEQMLKQSRAGNEWHGSIHNLKKSGSLYLEAIDILPLEDVDGENSSYVMIKKDITEQRRLESIASSANLMDNVGFVFSGVRHELGNPVNSLKMTLSVLSKKLDEFSSEQVVEFLDRSQNEIGRIEYLLQSLRSFSMFESPVVQKVWAHNFLRNFFFMHQQDLERKGVQVEFEVASDAEEFVADERALHQVLLNLLTNSLNALEKRAAPMIQVRVFRQSDDLLCLSFEDNGCGISKNNKGNLFKPFFTTKPEGTGMGLVIVQKMLVEMNCFISVKSQKNRGTTFFILLPVR